MEHKTFHVKLSVALGMQQYLRRMWELFTDKKSMGQSSLVGCGKERQEGIQGNWQKESPFKQYLELVKRGSDLSCDGGSMCRAYNAGRSGWESHKEEFQKDGGLSVWASMKVKECYDKVESEDTGRLSVAQDILRKSTDFLRESSHPLVEWEVAPCLIVIVLRYQDEEAMQLVVCGLWRPV